MHVCNKVVTQSGLERLLLNMIGVSLGVALAPGFMFIREVFGWAFFMRSSDCPQVTVVPMDIDLCKWPALGDESSPNAMPFIVSTVAPSF